jgi:hypothetical protein
MTASIRYQTLAEISLIELKQPSGRRGKKSRSKIPGYGQRCFSSLPCRLSTRRKARRGEISGRAFPFFPNSSIWT